MYNVMYVTTKKWEAFMIMCGGEVGEKHNHVEATLQKLVINKITRVWLPRLH